MNISSRGNPLHDADGILAYLRIVENGCIGKASEPGSVTTRILLVDDDALVRQLCAQVLRCFGYQTETAKDGALAWKALQAKSFDLLITDNNMPKVSGVELVKKVRSAHMALPVILVSGTLPTEELDRDRWLQPVATLAKPFTGNELRGTVRRVLRESAVTREQTESSPIFSQGKLGNRAPVVSNHGSS
jgi:DNA-binding response OmpR family regulator